MVCISHQILDFNMPLAFTASDRSQLSSLSSSKTNYFSNYSQKIACRQETKWIRFKCTLLSKEILNQEKMNGNFPQITTFFLFLQSKCIQKNIETFPLKYFNKIEQVDKYCWDSEPATNHTLITRLSIIVVLLQIQGRLCDSKIQFIRLRVF